MEDAELDIRLATPDDMDEIMHLAYMACEDNSFLDYTPELLAQEIWPALNMDHGLFPVIGQRGGPIEGFVLLRIGHMWYSTRQVLEEKCLWVHPEYRSAKGGRAKKLLDFTKKTADTLQMPLVIGIMSTNRTDGKTRLYTRVFGEPAGTFFLYNAACGGHKRTDAA